MLKLKHLEIHPDPVKGQAFIVIPSGDPETDDEIANLDPVDVALAAAYLFRAAEAAAE